MRYLGDVTATGQAHLFPKGSVQREQLLAAAARRDDAEGELLLDLADATDYGSKQKLQRYGLGALAGLVVGVVVGKWVI